MRVARSFLPSTESQSSTKLLADGREWPRGGGGLLVDVPNAAVLGLTRRSRSQPVIASREIDDARGDRVVAIAGTPPIVVVLAHRIGVAEMVTQRGRDGGARAVGAVRATHGLKSALKAIEPPQGVDRERTVGRGDLLRDERDEVIGMNEDAVGGVHPAMTRRRRLEIDGESIAVGDHELRADRLLRVEHGFERALHLGRLEDLASDERLRDRDALAEAGSETIRVERDAGRVRAVTADLPGLGLHEDARLARLGDLEQDHGLARLGEPVPVLPGVGVPIGRRLGEDRVRRTAFRVLLRLRERIAVGELAPRVQREHFLVPDAGALGDPAKLFADSREELFDDRCPPRRLLEDLVPAQARSALEALLVERDGALDLGAGGFAVLA